MDREIKFRAWDKELKKFTYPDLFSKSMPSNWRDWYFLQQHTGLKDKNGVDIYEGDIVAVPNRRLKAKKNPTYITEIVYRGHGFVLKYNDTYFNERACITKTVEIIGNVFENPELLKP